MRDTDKVTAETLQRLVDAFNAHDLDAVMSFFTDDAVLELPRGPYVFGPGPAALDGLIRVDREEIVEGRLRRYYRLTPEGAAQLAAEATRFQSNAAAALARLGLAGGMAR